MSAQPAGMPSPAAPAVAYRTRPPGRTAGAWRICRTLLFGYDIFLSHSHSVEEGRAYATALWPRLEELGLTTCFDRDDFHPGEPLHLKMRRSVSSSRALVLLDTQAARESGPIKEEVAAAVANGLAIIVIRFQGLGTGPWSGVEAPDPLIFELEAADAFRQGHPSGHILDRISARFRWTRVQTKFRRFAAAIAIVLLAATGWFAVERLFANGLANVYASMHDRRTPIVAVDGAFGRLRDSWLTGGIGRHFHAAELSALTHELENLQIKELATGVKKTPDQVAVDEARLQPPWSRGNSVDVAPKTSAVVAIQNEKNEKKVFLYRERLSSTCWTVPGEPLRVAIDREGSRIAELSTEGVFVWSGGNCEAEAVKVDLSNSPLDLLHVVALGFGNEGRSLLVSDASRAVVIGCETGGSCAPSAVHEVARIKRGNPATSRSLCEVAISPATALVAALSGDCEQVRRDLCVFAGKTRCSWNSLYFDIAFDPSGQRVVAARPHVAEWDVKNLDVDRTGDAVVDEQERSFEKEYVDLTKFDALAFDDSGTRLLIAKAYDTTRPQVAITVYEWPHGVLRQALTLETTHEIEAIHMILGPQIRLEAQDGSGRREQFTLDLRRGSVPRTP
jgi:hypothetical protein